MKNILTRFNVAARAHACTLACLVAMMLPSVMSATSYVTLNDGRLLVFPDTCVSSMVEEDGMLSFTALNGAVFSYALADIKSVDEEMPRELPTITSYKFNNKYNYELPADAEGVIDGDVITVEANSIGKRLTASFNLSDKKAVATVDGVVQESKVSRLRFATSRVYFVGIPGDCILTRESSGAYSMQPLGTNYTVNVNFLTANATSFPRIDINTVGGVPITSKVDYVDAEIIIDGAGIYPSMTDSLQIRGRGNTSWSNSPGAKNPYRLKFASKVKPFGLSKGKNWVLLSNRLGGSALTNAVGMKAASLMGTAAVNHIIPVELYLNGQYRGVYNFTEKVGFAGNSVDIDDETMAALLELDTYYDEPENQKFRSDPFNLPVNVKEPEFEEGETRLTLEDIENRFNAVMELIYNGEDFTNDVDVDYLARYLMVNEYICNNELFHPKSTYCYNENILSDSSKFIFGPVWDLDWAFGYNGTQGGTYFYRNIEEDYYNEFTSIIGAEFWPHVRSNLAVARRIYEVWNDFKANGLTELCEFVYDFYNYVEPAFNRNLDAGFDMASYSRQVSRTGNWLRNRAAFISGQMALEFEKPGDVNGDTRVTVGDIAMLIEHLLSGTTITTFYASNADVDSNGMVNVGDVAALINLLLTAE